MARATNGISAIKITAGTRVNTVVWLTISILNRVARRTKQSSQANAAAGPSAEALKDPIWSELSFREAEEPVKS
jgi:hypothetical protein